MSFTLRLTLAQERQEPIKYTIDENKVKQVPFGNFKQF